MVGVDGLVGWCGVDSVWGGWVLAVALGVYAGEVSAQPMPTCAGHQHGARRPPEPV